MRSTNMIVFFVSTCVKIWSIGYKS